MIRDVKSLNSRIRLLALFAGALPAAGMIAVISGCSGDYADVRYEVKPDDPENWMNVAKGIRLKGDMLTEAPPSFMGNSLACKAASGMFPGIGAGIPLHPEGGMIFQVKIRNDTPYVVKLKSSEITLFDPDGVQYAALNRDALKLHFLAERPCQDTPQLTLQYSKLALIDGDFKILPGRANAGYVIFKPTDSKMPGDWSVSFYDLSVDSVKPLPNAEPETLTYKFTLNKIADVFTKIDWTGSLYAKTTRTLTKEDTPEKVLEEVKASKVADEEAAARSAAERAAAEDAAERARKAAEKAAEEKAVAEKAAEEATAQAIKEAAAKEAAEKASLSKIDALKLAVAKAIKAANEAADREAEARAAAQVEAKTAETAANWQKWR